jgi:hypothetical protein
MKTSKIVTPTLSKSKNLLSGWFGKKQDKFVNQQSTEDKLKLTDLLNSNKHRLYLSSEYLPKFYNKFIYTGDDIVSKISDFNSMSKDPILARALKQITNDVTQYSPITKSRIWCVSDDPDISDINDIFYDENGINEKVWYSTNRTAKYGTCFVRLTYAEEDFTGGISYVEFEDDILRYIPIELNGVLIKWIDKYTNILLEPFEVYAFRVNMSNDYRYVDNYYSLNLTSGATGINAKAENKIKNTFIYGTGFFENCRRIWKQRLLAEDSIMLSRLENSPRLILFKIAAEGLTSETAADLVDYYVELLNYDHKTLNIAENILKGGESQIGYGAKVALPVGKTGDLTHDVIGGDPDIQYIRDLERLDAIFYASLGIHKALLGLTDDLPGSLGESVIVKLEEVYARDAKELQYSQMLGWKTISYYHYMSKGIFVDFSDFDIVMNTVSNTEDEAFKSAFRGGLEGFSSFVSLITDVKNLIGETENKEVIDILKFLTTKLLNISDFNWDKFFDSFYDENGIQQAPEEKQESKKRLFENIQRIDEAKRKKLYKKVSSWAYKSTHNIPKFSKTNTIKNITEQFKSETKQNKYIKESKIISEKLNLNKDSIRKILEEVKYFDIDIFDVKSEEFDFTLSNYDYDIKQEKVKYDKLIFMNGLFHASDINLANISDKIILYKKEDSYYINYTDSCKLLKMLNEDKMLDKYEVINLKEKVNM